MDCPIAMRVRARSFSSERTRILRLPCSIARMVCSRYATLRGCVIAVSISDGLRLSPQRAAREAAAASSRVRPSMKGCADLAMSNFGDEALADAVDRGERAEDERTRGK